MRVAIIGSGIAGLSAAFRLSREHDIRVYEAGSHVGGHSNTVEVPGRGGALAVDTGFIVYNDRTYPGFSRLLDELGVPTQDGEMSFSFRDAGRDFEYCGSNLNGLFAQRRNLLDRRFNRMVLDILDFNRRARDHVANGDDTLTLAQFLDSGGWSEAFVNHYIVPMGSAIWSMPSLAMREFPALYFLRFFANHGLLQLRDRPRWRTVTGGSARYVTRLTQSFRDRIRLRDPVRLVQRKPDGVRVCSDNSDERFDAVFVACHSDQALRIIDRPHTVEQSILGAIPYQPNEAVLHTDTSLLPRRRRAWAAWNYHSPSTPGARTALTYNMNRLQQLPGKTTYCVTLNCTDEVDPAQIIGSYAYDHPVYTRAGVAAQQRYTEINGLDRLYYCGAYWGYGFHEDGYQSAQRACRQFEQDIGDGKLHLRRVG